MLLAIDVGNTNIVFAVYDGDKQVTQWRVETARFDSVECTYDITDIIACSVVPKVNVPLIEACQNAFGMAPVFITKDNIDIGIKTNNLGADRMVGASGAVAHYGAPCVIVDFGTSTNFDVVNEKGEHCGGVLTTGARLSLSALSSAAAQLPEIDIEKPGKVIGTNTKDAMQSGMYWGYISMAEGLIDRIRGEAGNNPIIIATGGLSSLFEQGTNYFDVLDQDLIMKGLVHLHKVLNKEES